MQEIRSTDNKATLIGRLASKKVTSGTSKSGSPYTSMRGEVQVGNDQANRIRFSYFMMANKRDGSPNERYPAFSSWANSVQTIVDDGEGAPVRLEGTYDVNDYFDTKNNQVRTGYEVKVFFNANVTPEDVPKFEVNFEGFIDKISPELDNQQETGRLKVSIWGVSYGRTGIPVVFYVPEELADQFEETYSDGDTAMMFLDGHVRTVAAPVETQGFGTIRVTEGRSMRELVASGGLMPYDEEDSRILDKKAMKRIMTERESRLANMAAEARQNITAQSTGTVQPAVGQPRATINARGEIQPTISPDLAMADMDNIDRW